MRRRHCPGPRCVFPQRRGARERAAPHPPGPQFRALPRQAELFGLHHSTWEHVLAGIRDTMGGTGPLSPGEKEDTLPLINPFPRWGASVCKTCLLHWSKKTPSQTQLGVSGFCTGLPGSLGCPAPTINNTTRQELRGGGEGLFSTFCKSGSVSNLSSAEAFLRLFGWAGRASPSASLGSSPRLRSSAAGPGDQRSELQPQALPLKADQGRGDLLPCHPRLDPTLSC